MGRTTVVRGERIELLSAYLAKRWSHLAYRR
ncbi:hypothetical protein ABIA38_008892 [Embleya sp. AB8]